MRAPTATGLAMLMLMLFCIVLFAAAPARAQQTETGQDGSAGGVSQGGQTGIAQPVQPNQVLQPFEALQLEPQQGRDPLDIPESRIPLPGEVDLGDFFQTTNPVDFGAVESFDARSRARVPSGGAAGLRVSASASLDVGVDSNPTLVDEDQFPGNTTGFAYDLQPSVTLSYRTRRLEVQSTARLSYNEVIVPDDDGGPDLESFDQFGGITLDYLRGLTTYNFFSNIANTTTRRGLVGDTGEVLNDNRFLSYGGGGSVTHRFGPRVTGRFFASGSRRQVDTQQAADFTSAQVGSSTTVTLTPRHSLAGTVQYELFMPDGSDLATTHTVSLLAQWASQLTKRISVSVEAGPQFILRDGGADTGDTNGVGFFLDGRTSFRTGERGTLTVNARRAVRPSSLGEVVTNSSAGIGYTRDFGRRVTLTVPFRIQERSGSLVDTFADRTLMAFTPRVRWSPSRLFSLIGRVEHRRLDIDGIRNTTSNGVFVQATVRGDTGI
ncbi:MAG: hypothetical protein ACFB6R_02690 [Alphaproteobacteria bacterium]